MKGFHKLRSASHLDLEPIRTFYLSMQLPPDPLVMDEEEVKYYQQGFEPLLDFLRARGWDVPTGSESEEMGSLVKEESGAVIQADLLAIPPGLRGLVDLLDADEDGLSSADGHSIALNRHGQLVVTRGLVPVFSNLPLLEPRRVEKHGRNEPCPCGSGKKFKKCCGA